MARSAMITLGGDLRVGRIGYGAMRLTGPNLWGEYADRDGGIALLRQAVEAGVTLIDTADVYGPHTNELLIREALLPYPEHLVIATKGGFVRGGPVGPRPTLIDAIGNATYLRQCAYLSARRLGVERIDLYYLHSGRAKDASFEDQVGTLAELRQLGLIRQGGGARGGPRSGRCLCAVAAGITHGAGLTFRHWRAGGGPSRAGAHCVPARRDHLADHARLATGTIA